MEAHLVQPTIKWENSPNDGQNGLTTVENKRQPQYSKGGYYYRSHFHKRDETKTYWVFSTLLEV